MPLKGVLAQQLPLLRRFARALAGSQAGGDAYVIATLELLTEDDSCLDQSDLRASLYAAFLRVWQSVPLNDRQDSPPETLGMVAAADRSLARLMPHSRVAFLLAALDGFTTAEIGRIMGLGEAEAATLQERARREIADMISTRVLIIEDEPIIAMDLEALVTDLGHTVTGVARTHREAVAAIAEDPPGLVLADIQLADGSSGLDAVRDILATIDLPVIFITAFPERLLTGDRPEPAFLISKPFRPDMVKAVISQALFFERSAGAPQAA
jgi:CheY-like chemotaxis protein/DNA-directed RNA polymerase specialized sigma24 family protein